MNEKYLGEAYETAHQIVIVGTPPDDDNLPEEQRHNCDAMGCGQCHVLARFTKPEHMK